MIDDDRVSADGAGASFLSGGGNMGALMRAYDWGATPLGPPARWPQSLCTAVSIMLESHFAMVVAWGPEFIFLYNDRYRPVLGTTKHPQALGKPAREIFPEVWDYIGPLFRKALAGEAVALDDQLIPLDRHGYLEECFFTLSYSPIRENGGIGGMLAVVAETTERVQNERQLALLRELAARPADARTLESACELCAECLEAHSQDFPFGMIYRVDADQHRATLAATARVPRGHSLVQEMVDLRAVGALWPFTEALHSGAPVLVSLDDRRDVDLPTAVGHAPKQAVVVGVRAQGPAGPAAILVLGLHPLRRFDDHFRRFVELVTAQVSAALANAHSFAEQRQRAEALAELDRAKTAFFSNVSHEFRTPLTLMLGPMDELLQESATTPDARVQELLPVMRRGGQRLQKLVNTLLDFSRIEAGRAQAVYEPIDLAAFTQELASMFRAAVERAGMQLVIDCPPLSQLVYVDSEMWEKVVLNLLSNAFKFTFEGEIRVSLTGEGGRAVLTVADTGIGIAESELPKIFDRFYRVEGARGRTHEGTGIGLALVHELVKLHGGSVSVESRQGRGSRFVVAIPFGAAHLPSERIGAERMLASTALRAEAVVEEALQWLPGAEQTEKAPLVDVQPVPPVLLPPGAASQSRGNILVVDDNADMRAYLRHLLEAAGFDVVLAADGRQAMEEIRAQPPDLVLTDIMMPNMDGGALLKALRSQETTRHIPVIVLSARAGEEARIAGFAQGADDYLVKPFSARELTARIETVLALVRERQRADATLREEAHLLETLNRVGQAVAAELDLTRVVQAVTDAATELTGASFGSFFYNVTDERGDSYWLYALSGAPREAFENFPMPRNTPLFAPTFAGEGIVRSDDVLADPRYGQMEPHRGMPKGHLPVRSYLAVPVKSRSGEVIGGLFFGHRDTGRFSERHERLVAGIAQQAAIAIDNARLYEKARMMETRQAALFEAERVARAAAEQAARMKDEFLATVSHELRTPLNAIVGWINVLQSANARPSDIQRAVEVIKRNAHSQAQLIEDLLDMSRIMSGRMRLDVQQVTLLPVIESAITSVLPAATAKDIRIQRVLDPLAGPITGDPGRLQQVMWNLLTNAIKFTPKGGRVQVTLERVNSHLEVSVSDTGVGIDPEFLPHVFDRFRQADASAARTYTGLGLGLAISKELVELHGGTIRVKSAGRDAGTVFVVSLPLAPVAQERLEPDVTRQHPRAARRDVQDQAPRLSLDGIAVLAVEDEPDALEIIVRVLTDAGAEVEGCSNAADALALLIGRRFDVIVSDLGMAGMDGYDFVRGVRALAAEQGGATPAIALSAFARSEDRQRAYRAGFQMHVAKPVDPAELITIISALAGGPRARQT
jgi:signal transduction histidine kinase/DNA-binding response OmpR family regulator